MKWTGVHPNHWVPTRDRMGRSSGGHGPQHYDGGSVRKLRKTSADGIENNLREWRLIRFLSGTVRDTAAVDTKRSIAGWVCGTDFGGPSVYRCVVPKERRILLQPEAAGQVHTRICKERKIEESPNIQNERSRATKSIPDCGGDGFHGECIMMIVHMNCCVVLPLFN